MWEGCWWLGEPRPSKTGQDGAPELLGFANGLEAGAAVAEAAVAAALAGAPFFSTSMARRSCSSEAFFSFLSGSFLLTLGASSSSGRATSSSLSETMTLGVSAVSWISLPSGV